jgi:NAD(P)-dependent dehydrogenase (short-subunit alcohol dehydrogenase family)
MDLKDAVIVVTGASSGIGAAVAEHVAKRGAKVVLVARREKELREVAARCGANALPVTCDVTKRSDVGRALAEAVARFGHVDAWINNAGRGITRHVSELTDEDFDDMILVNVKSALYGMQAVLPHFKSRGKGHIVNVSTMLSRLPLFPPRSAYSAAKAALNSLTSSLRCELRATHPNIHVTAVYPGVVATDFGLHARHGGADSRTLPHAQPVEGVAEVIAGALESPRGDVYTRPGMKEMLVAYDSADDTAVAETKPPFAKPASPPQ